MTATVISRGIQTTTVRELEAYDAALWMMSPPCQPHTRQNTTVCNGRGDYPLNTRGTVILRDDKLHALSVDVRHCRRNGTWPTPAVKVFCTSAKF
jgi:hypothetical protein